MIALFTLAAMGVTGCGGGPVTYKDSSGKTYTVDEYREALQTVYNQYLEYEKAFNGASADPQRQGSLTDRYFWGILSEFRNLGINTRSIVIVNDGQPVELIHKESIEKYLEAEDKQLEDIIKGLKPVEPVSSY